MILATDMLISSIFMEIQYLYHHIELKIVPVAIELTVDMMR